MEEQIKSEDQKEFIVMTPDQLREVYETAAKIGAERRWIHSTKSGQRSGSTEESVNFAIQNYCFVIITC